jgi:hypothetical protein
MVKYLLFACTFITKICHRSTLALSRNTGQSTIGGNGHQLIKSWVQLCRSYWPADTREIHGKRSSSRQMSSLLNEFCSNFIACTKPQLQSRTTSTVESWWLNSICAMKRMIIYEVHVHVMHLSMVCPRIPLPCGTRWYQGVFTGEAGPRVGHLTFPYTLT